MATLQKIYQTKLVKQLMTDLGYKNPMQVPELQKITLNIGLSKGVGDKKILDAALKDLTAISGQKAVATISKKSIAGFKIREGWPIGCKVTLRKKRMYEFLERLISIAIPRIRDFRGFTVKSFDGQGNYSFGIEEQIIFPEINYDKIDSIRGLDITLTIRAKSDKDAYALLKAFGFPFKERSFE